jgi:hypothetical protein
LLIKGFKFVGAQPTSLFGLGRDLISYGKTNADGRLNWHFRRETMEIAIEDLVSKQNLPRSLFACKP